ncbi:fluoride efflux transporter CrcB [Agaribacter marinus]|uniref:Fluoride-specific ion channel FluC n=1 Tax=Agaribacter marinus TaxID=1431249 RepID=A0AA37SUB5_9ALTE|nr:fluoride efflux transporter CrcB [Agaribacter marinus]GLR69981.1 putative fluoride ion transporter CrcB [Agaribacter marinus]
MQTLYLYLAVAGGGAIGACMRLFVNQTSINLLGKGFPFGTLAVNVVGSFLIGLLYAWFEQQEVASPILKAFLTVGMLGALTTFSTFSLDTILLMQAGSVLKAIGNIILNLSLCLLCVWLAITLAKG